MKIDYHSRWPTSKPPKSRWHVYTSNYPDVPKSQMLALRWAAQPSNWINIHCVNRHSCQAPGGFASQQATLHLLSLLVGSHSTWGRFRFFFLISLSLSQFFQDFFGSFQLRFYSDFLGLTQRKKHFVKIAVLLLNNLSSYSLFLFGRQKPNIDLWERDKEGAIGEEWRREERSSGERRWGRRGRGRGGALWPVESEFPGLVGTGDPNLLCFCCLLCVAET